MFQLHLIIYGKVQGIGLRATIQLKAQSLNLTGFAKNLNSGAVEVLAYGERENLETLCNWLKGSPGASIVKSIEEEWKETEGNFSKFNVF